MKTFESRLLTRRSARRPFTELILCADEIRIQSITTSPSALVIHHEQSISVLESGNPLSSVLCFIAAVCITFLDWPVQVRLSGVQSQRFLASAIEMSQELKHLGERLSYLAIPKLVSSMEVSPSSVQLAAGSDLL